MLARNTSLRIKTRNSRKKSSFDFSKADSGREPNIDETIIVTLKDLALGSLFLAQRHLQKNSNLAHGPPLKPLAFAFVLENLRKDLRRMDVLPRLSNGLVLPYRPFRPAYRPPYRLPYRPPPRPSCRPPPYRPLPVDLSSFCSWSELRREASWDVISFLDTSSDNLFHFLFH